MFKPMMFSIAALAASFGTSASAANFNILIVEGGFFPEITYVQPGDSVTFVNQLTVSATATASDESWSTGPLSVNATYNLPIAAETALIFSYASDSGKSGVLSFDFAPLDADAPLLDEVVETEEPESLD
ncbi:cupredoxin domain-containing protein [Planktotalea sp.]|uniref:cupredoxin domain-containing protein n=1 Tax=Planktotalea sp. TaxID=2029877 RepID=UPI003D6A0F0F